jgi:hypothetical protein
MAVSTSGTEPHFQQLCFTMGLTLAVWQRLEETHFRVFLRTSGLPRDICSMIYHGIPSFEGRRVMVDRVMQCDSVALAEELKSEWSAINAKLETASTNRNKIAHYVIDYEFLSSTDEPDGGVSVRFGNPHLRPSPVNQVEVLRGRTPDKKGHKLTPDELRQYIVEFNALIDRLQKLAFALPYPPTYPIAYGEGLRPFLEME